MASIPKQQILEDMTQQLSFIADNMATKDDVKQVETNLERVETRVGRVETRVGSIETKIDRLSDRVSSNHTVNVNHHLAMRKDIGDLDRQYNALREGLAQAAKPG